MPKTIQQGFDQLKSNLNITDIQQQLVSQRQQAIRAALERQFVVRETFLMGSYRRSTLTAPLATADVDIFVVLDHKHFAPAGQAALLERLREALRNTYATSKIKPDGQAVTITFTEFMVDVVPGFLNPAGIGYLIPNAEYQGWTPTNPKRHTEVWAEQNAAHSGHLIPLLKMLKGWKITSSAPLRSFHLETLGLQILRGVRISDYPSGVRFVFDKARERVTQRTPDEAGFGGNVGEYLVKTNKVSAAVDTIGQAYNLSLAAESSERRGDTRGAFEQWRLLFGNYFPAYG